MVGHIVDEPTVIRAWISAASYLCRPSSPPSHMTVSAGTTGEICRRQLQQLDACAAAAHVEHPSAVANMVLPYSVMTTAGSVTSRLESGWSLLGRARRRGLRFSGWRHTYYERLTGHWMDRDSVIHQIKENRLRSIIEKINLWDRDVEAALYAHTDSASDKLRPRGAPCLQYVQFRPFDSDKLELFALYRSHDYFSKSLGNMVGLQRLGEFVAEETGRKFVGETIFSVHPTYGTSKAALGSFVASVAAIPGI